MLVKLIKDNIKIGDILYTPNHAEKRICSITDEVMIYEHGRSRVWFLMADIVSAYERFKGTRVSSKDLRKFSPHVFDSKQCGHSCNAIVFQMIMVRCGLTYGDIQGTGLSGNPFYIQLKQL